MLLQFFLVAGFLHAASADACDWLDAQPLPRTPPVRIDGARFVDSSNRTVVLRGVNAVANSKVPPFMPVTAAAFDPLPNWGMNFVRLLFTWEGYEPERCEFNEEYMTYYRNAVRDAAARGLYVVVDFHQDGFSRFTTEGCGEGFPSWAVHSSIQQDTPDNSEACSSWAFTMILNANHHTAWSHFHADSEGARTRYAIMLGRVAAEMAKESNVIGYHLINEPWGTPAEIADLFTVTQAAIVKYDPDAFVLISPHCLVSGLGPDLNPQPSFQNYAYSPNYYDLFAFVLGVNTGLEPDDRLNSLKDKADNWNVPTLFGEFGVSPNLDDALSAVDRMFNWFDQHFVSGAYWSFTPDWTPETKDGWNGEDFSIVDDKGELRDNYRPRPHVQILSGTGVAQSNTDSAYSLTWDNAPGRGATELFLPLNYLDNKVVTITTETSELSTDACTLTAGIHYACDIAATGQITLTIATVATEAPSPWWKFWSNGEPPQL